jgi:hypothetical protein
MRERLRFIGIGVGRIVGLVWRIRRIEQLPRLGNVVDALAAGKQAVALISLLSFLTIPADVPFGAVSCCSA